MARRHRPLPTRTAPPRAHWGLREPQEPSARRVERRWRGPLLVALLATIPAFYADMLDAVAPLAATLAYVAAALLTAAALAHTARHTRQPWRHVAANPVDVALAAGAAAAALLPASATLPGALGLRLAVSLLVLVRLLWSLQGLITRGGLAYLLLLSLGVLGLCGAGFWWLEPTVTSLGDGLWLAFTTAATVGYGDMVPTTAASKIFAVFVVLLGFGVLTMVTAAIATTWIESEERRIEREILGDLREQIDGVHAELGALRAELRSAALLLADRRAHPRGAEPSEREPV